MKRAELIRYTENDETRKIIPFDLELVLKKEGLSSTLLLKNDFINVLAIKRILGDEKYIEIIGMVKRPGKYVLHEENMTLYDLLFKTAGLDDQILDQRFIWNGQT